MGNKLFDICFMLIVRPLEIFLNIRHVNMFSLIPLFLLPAGFYGIYLFKTKYI